jgi:colanic acid/amylovoran biosynthesis glycosyltransferase
MKKLLLFFMFTLISVNIFCVTSTKKRMKIFMFVSAFPQINNVSATNQITGLIDKGHDVTIHSFGEGDFVNVQSDVAKYGLINKMVFKIPASFDDYDIVMFQMGHKLFDIRTTHNYKGKIVVCIRGHDITSYLKSHPHAYDEYFKSCDLFLPVCRAFRNLLIKAGCPRNKIVVQHSCINRSTFKFRKRSLPKHGIIRMVSAGRLVEKKGMIYSILAFERLLKKYPNLRYTIIGDGELNSTLQYVGKMLGLRNKLKFITWLVHEEYAEVLNKSHIFVLPSITAQNNNQEGIANVLKEAMAMGLPVVTTEHSGNAELINHGITGLLVPERDVDALYNAIDYMLSSPAKWTPMQIAAAKKVEKDFDKEKENDKLEAILYELLQK